MSGMSGFSSYGSSGYTCATCGVWVGGGLIHTCIPAPLRGTAIPPPSYDWTLSRIAGALERIAKALDGKDG